MDFIYNNNGKGLNNRRAERCDKYVILVSAVLLSGSVILANSIIVLAGLCVASALLYIIIQNYCFGTVRLVICSYTLISIAFVTLSGLSAVWAFYSNTTPIANALQILIFMIPNFFLCFYVLRRKTNLSILIRTLEIAGFIVAIYTYRFYGTSEFSRLLSEGKRIGNDFANANVIGVFIAIGILSCVYDILYVKVRIYKVLLLIPCVYILAYSGSRKALLAFAAGVFFLWLHRFRGKNFLSTIFKWTIAIVLIIIIGIKVLSLSIFSSTLDRIDMLKLLNSGSLASVDHGTYMRELYLKIGSSAFLSSPLFGIGIGNTNYLIEQLTGRFAYTHNNYLEMLACLGIIGFNVYYLMWFKPLTYIVRNSFRRKFQDPECVFCIVIGFLLLAMDIAMVPYLDISNYYYIMVISAEALLLRTR